MDYSFLILFIGVATVVGMIVGLRINAFVALITAALVVSFLSPGEVGDKVARVATAFGATAGGVGIVIALAAVIGKCLMESRAADRIVDSFVKLLGEKRSPLALSGSGFVLSIPVFFDTVFYLLVPLARSLYRKTGKNFVLYVTAISAGAAATHALVPPTPGPLLMAQQLDVGLGWMIGIGALVGLPAAAAGLLFCSWINRRMPIAMRPLPGDHDEQDGEEEADAAVPSGNGRRMPPLWLALLPIVLPLVLIGANTALETRANGERAARVGEEDIRDFATVVRLVETSEGEKMLALREAVAGLESVDRSTVTEAINSVLRNPDAFDTGKNLKRKNLAIVEHENRKIVDEFLPDSALAPQQWETPARRAANLSQLYGNANFALLLSAAISVLLYVGMRRPGKKDFAETLESALMSGGLIILITAAGGAFGAMLNASGIGEAIARNFPSESGSAGTALLFLAFGVAALIKFAQGSTTVAVITTAGLMAAMLGNIELSFHRVYLATAIGGGGLVGSWMNDSGFWIFSKMSGLTEVETLKTWTPLLSILGIVAFLCTVVLSLVLPLG